MAEAQSPAGSLGIPDNRYQSLLLPVETSEQKKGKS